MFFLQNLYYRDLASVIMLFNPSFPSYLRTIFAIYNVTLMNIMTCRVYRDTLFGSYREAEISSSFILRELNVVIPPFVLEGGSGGRQTGYSVLNVDGIAITDMPVEHINERAAQ